MNSPNSAQARARAAPSASVVAVQVDMNIELKLKVEDLNARYVQAIDDNKLEAWPDFFTEQGRYRVTTAENFERGLPLGMIYATSRAMLRDRVRSLREANVYEAQRYRHVIGVPLIAPAEGGAVRAQTSFIVARIMQSGETTLFATGRYHDQNEPRRRRARYGRDSGRWRGSFCREDRDPRQPADRHAARHSALAAPHARARRRLVDASPFVRAVLVRAHLHQRRLHDAGGGGRLADLRAHQRSVRPRPGWAGAIRAAGGIVSGDRAGRRSLRSAHRRRHLSGGQSAGRACARAWHRARLAHPRRHAGHPVRVGHRARVRNAEHPRAAARHRAGDAVAARDRRLGERAADRRHLRALARRAVVYAQPD